MRAARRTAPEVLEVVDIPEPDPGSHEVLVDVVYAGVNPFDMQVLRGQFGGDVPLTLGAEATGLLDGSPVHVSGGGLGSNRDGTYAEQVAVPRTAVRPLPPGADLRTSATVGIAGRTAWRAVHQLGGVTEDDVVLVLGASGGVGIFAAQLARATGAEVLAHTGSRSKASRLEALGLQTVVADQEELVARVSDRGVTVVLDALGGDYLSSLLGSMAPGGRAVNYGVLAGATTQVNLATIYGKGLRVLGSSGSTTPPAEATAALEGALNAVLDGTVVVDVEVLPLEQADQAFERLRSRRVLGKLLLEVGGSTIE